jgi:hypothetical protein
MASTILKQAGHGAQRYGEVVLVWLVLSASSTFQYWPDLIARRFRDTDDATRLVETRELLDGQSWWDLELHRLGEAGSEMHWSRHMDAMLAVPTTALRPFVGTESAELVSIILVPSLLLLISLWLIRTIADHIVPRGDAGLYAMVAGALMVGVLHRLTPGALDHHGLQIVLVLLVVRALQMASRLSAGRIAGIATGTALTIGLETLPILAVAIGAWLVASLLCGRFEDGGPRAFGVALLGSAVASSLLFSPPDRLLSAQCDVFSLGYLGLIAVPSIGLFIIVRAKLSTQAKLVTLALSAGVGLLWFLKVSPECAAGPYHAVPIEAQEIWLSQITEAQSFRSFAGARPLRAFGMALGPAVALAYLGYLVRVTRRRDLIVLLSAMVAAVLAGMWQVRVAPFASVIAAPVLGAVATRIRHGVRSEVAGATLAVVSVVALSGFVPSFLADAEFLRGDAATTVSLACLDSQALAAIEEQRHGLIAAEMDLGPELLVGTTHRVLTAPYHRAYEGVLRLYELLLSNPAASEKRHLAAGIDYIFICDDTSLMANWRSDDPGALINLLEGDSPPPWLDKVFDSGRSRLYSVRR